jgi:hypothetical protein
MTPSAVTPTYWGKIFEKRLKRLLRIFSSWNSQVYGYRDNPVSGKSRINDPLAPLMAGRYRLASKIQ